MDDDRRLTDFHVTDRGNSDAAGPLRVTAENSSGIPMATPYKRILPKLWSDNFYLTKKPRTTLGNSYKQNVQHQIHSPWSIV